MRMRSIMFSVCRCAGLSSIGSLDRRARMSLSLRSGRQRRQARHAQEVVGARCEVGVELRAIEAHEATLSHAGNGLEPAEDLLDALAMTLTDPVTRMACRPSIETRRASALDAGNVRADLVLAQIANQSPAAVAFVGAEGERANALAALSAQQRHRRHGLRPSRIGQLEIHTQPLPVIHERVGAKAELGRLAPAAAHEFGLGVGGADMRVVGASLASKIHHPSAVAARAWRGSALLLQALEARPRLDQSRVHGEVLGREQLLAARQANDRLEEATAHITAREALAQTREVRLIEP